VSDSSSKCEYLVGDDTCRAVKEDGLSGARDNKCRNTKRDACCYVCACHNDCEIGCDLQDKTPENDIPERLTTSERIEPERGSQDECGNCSYYLKSKCPRHYRRDAELWRKQEVCELFRPR